MGFSIKKITKPLGKLSVATRAIDPFNLSGADQSGFLPSMSDILLGKKSKDIGPDKIAGQIRAAQTQGIVSAQKGLGELNTALEKPADQVVRAQAATESKGVLSAAQDARRRAQMLMAQRGLKNSSLGLSSERSITQNLGEQQANIQASLPGRIRSQALSDAQTRMSAGQGLFAGLGGGAGVNFNTIKGQRSGGLLGYASALAPIAGSIGGMMAGNPAAAASLAPLPQQPAPAVRPIPIAGGGWSKYGNHA